VSAQAYAPSLADATRYLLYFQNAPDVQEGGVMVAGFPNGYPISGGARQQQAQPGQQVQSPPGGDQGFNFSMSALLAPPAPYLPPTYGGAAAPGGAGGAAPSAPAASAAPVGGSAGMSRGVAPGGTSGSSSSGGGSMRVE
jgi:hypothetical protein